MNIVLIHNGGNFWEVEDILHDAFEDCEIFSVSDMGAAFAVKEETVEMVLIDFDTNGPFSKMEIKKIRRRFKDASFYFMINELNQTVRNVMRLVDGFLLKPLEADELRALSKQQKKSIQKNKSKKPEKRVPSDNRNVVKRISLKGFLWKHYRLVSVLFAGISILSVLIYGICQYNRQLDRKKLLVIQQELIEEMKEAESAENTGETGKTAETASEYEALEMLPTMQVLYEKNSDVAGWLFIPDTVINYPVMQTPEEEEYYIRRDFDGNENRNGTLFADTDSVIGIGKAENGYTYPDENGNPVFEKPSTNIMIYGHTMKTGDMFGNLKLYQKEEYGKEHNVIYFDTLYEKREYEVLSVFYSKIFNRDDDVFKYYQFFQAVTAEEFDAWYRSIKEKSLYDTGVEAEFGDEFITLSCCSYHVENGRFAVIGKRIK